MRRRRTLLIGSAVVAATLASTGVVLAETNTASVPETLNVMSWNICGEAGGVRGQAGYCPHRNEPEVKVEQIMNLVDEYDLDVLLLQEVCAETADSHMGLLEVALGDEWTVGNARGARPDGRTDCRGDLNGELGLGIAVKSTVDVEFEIEQTLPIDPTGENLATLPTLCATTGEWPTRVCTTHILAEPSDPRRADQVQNVHDYVWPYRDDLVLGGDFNLFPESTELEPISDSFAECDAKAHGSGDEVDEFTHHAWNNGQHVYRKRDHIFASGGDLETRFTACDSLQELMDETANEPESGPPSGYSDHAPVIGSVRVL